MRKESASSLPLLLLLEPMALSIEIRASMEHVMFLSPRLQAWLPVTLWVAVHARAHDLVVGITLQVVASRTWLPLELLRLPERKSMIDTPNQNHVLGIAAVAIPVAVMMTVAPTSAARVFRTTLVRAWPPWDSAESKKNVATTAETIVESIVGSIGTTENGVIAGDIGTTIIRIQMRKAIITAGTRDGAKAREM